MPLQLTQILRFVLANFGPLIMFYVINQIYGLKLAIVASTIFAAGEVTYKFSRGEKVSTLFKFSAIVTIIFGVAEVFAQQDSLFRYESAVTNLLTGLFFGMSVFSPKTLLQDFYEQRKDAKPVTPDLAAYFRSLTLIWMTYFLVKATVYAWVAQNYSMEQGILIRLLVGSGSFYLLLAVSIFGSRPIFHALKRRGYFRERFLTGATGASTGVSVAGERKAR